MARPSPSGIAKAVQPLASLILTPSNINWKGFKPVLNFLKSIPGRAKGFADSVDLKDYWGRLILVTIAGLLIGFVLFDWRSQAVQKTEAKAALAVAVAERDTLALKLRADEAARLERTLILSELAKMDEVEIKELQEALDANPDWASQPIPTGVRNSLRE